MGLIIIGPSGSSALCRWPEATLLRTNKVSLCRLYNKLHRSTAEDRRELDTKRHGRVSKTDEIFNHGFLAGSGLKRAFLHFCN